MSVLKVNGSAKESFPADVFLLYITISVRRETSGEAIEAGKKETEAFLKLMRDEFGIEPGSFTLGKFDVGTSYADKNPYRFNRDISLTLDADPVALEKITMTLTEMSDISFSLGFSLSNESECADEVVKKAVEDSRNKAEVIARSLNMNIVGANDVRYSYSSYDEPTERTRGILVKSITVEDDDLASKLKNAVVKISRTVEIEWIAK